MAAKAEQIPAPSPIAAPSDAPDPAPDLPRDGAADGEVPVESAVSTGRAADGEEALLPAGDLRGDSPSPVVHSQEDDGAKDETKSTPDGEEDQGAEDGQRGGGGGKRGDIKGALFLPDAKRRKACPAALENLPTPHAAGELGAGGGGGWRAGAPGTASSSSSSPSPPPPSFSFSFSFDTRGFGAPPIETTPKFGSFNFAAIASAGSGAEVLDAAAGGGGGGGDEAEGDAR